MITSIKKLLQNIEKHLLVIILASSASFLLAAILGKAWPILLWSFILAFLSFRLPKTLNTAITIRFFIILFTLIALVQFESIIFWLLRIDANSFIYSIVTLLSVATVPILRLINKGTDLFEQKIPRPGRTDILLLLPAIIVTGAFWGRVVLHPKADDTAIVQSITFGMDDATHLGMFGDVLRSEGNLLAGTEERFNMSKSTHASYPMGWHVSSAVVFSSAYDLASKPVIEQVRAYFYAKLFALFSLIVGLAIFTFSLARHLKVSLDSIAEKLAFIITIATISVIIAIPLYFEGFFSFLPVLAYLLLFSTILIESSLEDENAMTDIILSLLVIASALTWMLTAPILIVALLAKKLTDHGPLKRLPKSIYIYALIGLGVMATQAYILVSAERNIINGLANEGGITHPSHMLLLLTFATFVYFYARDNINPRLTRNLTFILIPLALALVAVLLFISLSSPTLTYYYFKIQTALLILLLPFFSIYILKILFESNKPSGMNQFTNLALVIALYGLSIPTIVGYEYFANIVNRAQDFVLTDEDTAEIINTSLNRTFSKDHQRIIYFYPDQPPRTILATNAARLSYVYVSCDQQIFSSVYERNTDELSKTLEKCIHKLPTIIINTSDSVAKDIKQQIPAHLITKSEIVFDTSE